MKNWYRDIIIILAVFTVGVFIGMTLDLWRLHQQTDKMMKTIDADYCLQDTVDEDCLKATLEKNKIKFSHIVLAQAKLESNNFTSSLIKTNNNMFGMKVAATRFTFATNAHDYGNYAKYESLTDCILDYKAWQMQQAYNITNDEAYFNLLANIYAEDPKYVEKLKKLIE